MANKKVAPVFYDKQRAQHVPMDSGTVIDPALIDAKGIISSDAGNLIVEGSDGGIRLKASDLICEAGNCDNLLQTCEDGKIFVERPNIVSKQKGNLIVEDRADGSAMLGFSEAVSEDDGNLVSKGKDGKLAVMGKNIVSTDKANLIKVTDGGRLEFTVDDMLSDVACNVIDVDKNGKVKLCLGMEYDVISGKMNLTGNDGAVIDSITIPSAASVLDSVELVKDPSATKKGYFLKLVFITSGERHMTVYADMNSLSDVYKGGNGIEITNGYTIAVKLGSDSGLTFDSNGGLKVAADVARKRDLDQYVKKSELPDIPAVPTIVGGDGITYSTSTKGGVTTGTIAVDLAKPTSGGTILGISGSGKLSAFAQLAASTNGKTKRSCIAIADRNGVDLAEASHIDIGSGLKLDPFDASENDHGGVLSTDLPSLKLSLKAVIDPDSDPDPNLRSSQLHLYGADGKTDMCAPLRMSNGIRATNNGGITVDPWESVVWNPGWTSSVASDPMKDEPLYRRVITNRNLAQLVYAHNHDSEGDSTKDGRFGHATASLFGHVKLTDSATDTHAAADGIAVSPKALESLLNRIKALEDAPAAGGFEFPIVKNWSSNTDHPYANLYVPANAPCYAVFDGDTYLGTYAKNTVISGRFVHCSYAITQGSSDTWTKCKNYFYNIIRTSWKDVPAPELFRYRFTQSENNVLQLDEGFFINSSTEWVGGNQYTGEWQPTSLFGVRCYPLSATLQLGMKNTNPEAEGLWKSRHAHEAYTVKTV